MSEEMSRELESQVTAQEIVPEEAVAEKIAVEEPVEIMKDFAAELEASYQTLNRRKIELAEGESGVGVEWVQFQQMMDDRTVVKMKISKAVKDDVVTILEEMHIFTPAPQLSTEYVEKLEDWQGRCMECIIITVDPEKRRLVLFGREVEREKKEVERKTRMEQFKAGDVVEGTVDGIRPHGASVKLVDDVDGLLHIFQISTQRIERPGAVPTEGQTVKVKILNMENGKLSLSMRVPSEQTTECEEHETFDYKEAGSVPTGLDDLLKGLKLQDEPDKEG